MKNLRPSRCKVCPIKGSPLRSGPKSATIPMSLALRSWSASEHREQMQDRCSSEGERGVKDDSGAAVGSVRKEVKAVYEKE